MKVARLIIYDFPDFNDLLIQLAKSLPEGVRKVDGGEITVIYVDEIGDSFRDAIIKQKELLGLIEKAKVVEL